MIRAALASLALVAACDPAMSMRGVVQTAPPAACAPAVSGDVYAGTRPVEGATVELTCPGLDRPAMSAVSDAEGRFRADNIGTISDDCTVRVSSPGYHVLEVPVAGLCARTTSFGCHFAAVYAELIPITEP